MHYQIFSSFNFCSIKSSFHGERRKRNAFSERLLMLSHASKFVGLMGW
jgi:hypothetical protein